MTPDQSSRALEALSQVWPLYLLGTALFVLSVWMERGKP